MRENSIFEDWRQKIIKEPCNRVADYNKNLFSPYDKPGGGSEMGSNFSIRNLGLDFSPKHFQNDGNYRLKGEKIAANAWDVCGQGGKIWCDETLGGLFSYLKETESEVLSQRRRKWMLLIKWLLIRSLILLGNCLCSTVIVGLRKVDLINHLLQSDGMGDKNAN